MSKPKKPSETDDLQEAIESALRFWGRAKHIPKDEVDAMVEQSRKIRDYYEWQHYKAHQTEQESNGQYKSLQEVLAKY